MMKLELSPESRLRLLVGVAVIAGSIGILIAQARWGGNATPAPAKYRNFDEQGKLEEFSTALLNRELDDKIEVRNRGIARFSAYYLQRGDRAAAENWMRFGCESGSPALLMFYGDYCAGSAAPAAWRTAAVCYREARDIARRTGVSDFADLAERKFTEIQKRKRP